MPLLAYKAPAPHVPLRFKSSSLLQTCSRGRPPVQHVAKSGSVATACDLTACRHLRFVYDSSLREGSCQASALRVRMHEDFFICIASSGRKHGGDITVMFRDTQGNATSYGEWQQRREVPAEPVSLSGMEQNVQGLHVSTQTRGRSHSAIKMRPDIQQPIGPVYACSARWSFETEEHILWGYGSTKVYADGILQSDVKALVLPDIEGIPWHMQH